MSTNGSRDDFAEADQQRITDRVNFIVEHRSVIDQAKGMMMLLYGIDANEAFEVIRHRSRQHRVKLHRLATQIVGDLVELSMSRPSLDRPDAHGLLHTAHQRIADVAARQMDGQSKT